MHSSGSQMLVLGGEFGVDEWGSIDLGGWGGGGLVVSGWGKCSGG